MKYLSFPCLKQEKQLLVPQQGVCAVSENLFLVTVDILQNQRIGTKPDLFCTLISFFTFIYILTLELSAFNRHNDEFQQCNT